MPSIANADPETDARFMAAAIALARRHLGATQPNPSVGAIVVAPGPVPHVLGRGVTAPGGRPHAEPQALAQAGAAARGATIYSTLEPCSHIGKTPPCVDAIIRAGIARVVVAVLDPDPRVAGRGCRFLREAGVDVSTGVMTAAAEEGLAGFLTHRRLGRPHLTLKLAVSPDGAIGRAGEANVAVTGAAARAAVHAMRAESDAVMVGIGTALADDPRLDVRLDGVIDRKPLRVVIDAEARLPLASRLVRTAPEHPVWVIAGGGAPSARMRALRDAGVHVIEAARDDAGRVSLADALRLLGLYGVMSVLCEGGTELAAALLAHDLVDRVALFEGAIPLGAGAIAAPPSLANRGAGLRERFLLVGARAHGPDRLSTFERRHRDKG
ncbi:MAG: bifunctional diaminohydroxyphosphoribosylaminopyrimidine deaminase/5-amino-6-(5-phosphoribosylamino)uracil reductase RibD [Hyphomicrobiaceae bacterium]|nr:bifunctional diaminohydroxyphosphoribosylaminopyrimidine deaminase/5-amino-6-(5-phosphoribosylamino)uracil reductase RibD [Hyphomicrobiaceae bacterium]